MTPQHIKFDNRFNKATAKGTRTRKTKIDYARRRWNVFFTFAFTVIVGGLVLNGINQPIKAETVKAQEVSEEPSERDTVAREIPRVEPVVILEQPKTRDEWIDQIFGSDARIMKAICQSEGSNNDRSMNTTLNKDGSWDIGTCQINLQAHWDKVPGTTKDEKVENLKNKKINIEVAKKVFDSRQKWDKEYGGFGAWSDYKNGKYKKHLK